MAGGTLLSPAGWLAGLLLCMGSETESPQRSFGANAWLSLNQSKVKGALIASLHHQPQFLLAGSSDKQAPAGQGLHKTHLVFNIQK